MLAVLRRRSFALLWAGGLVSLAGDWLLLVALPYTVFERTGSALATGGVFIAETLPALLFGPLAGVLADRWDRQRTMVAADLVRALLLLPLLAVRSGEGLWVVYAVAFVQAAVAQVFGPAQSALLPRLVGERQLVAANALTGLSNEVTRLVAAPLGGALAAGAGLPVVVLLDSATYLVSAAAIAGIAVPPAAPEEAPPAPGDGPRTAAGAVRRAWGELRAGLDVVGRDRLVAGVFAVVAICTLGQGMINTVIIPFLREGLGASSRDFGFFVAAQGVGGLAGAAAAPRVARAVGPARLIGPCALLSGALGIAIPFAPSWTAALVLVAAVGAPAIAFFVVTQSALQGAVAPVLLPAAVAARRPVTES